VFWLDRGIGSRQVNERLAGGVQPYQIEDLENNRIGEWGGRLLVIPTAIAAGTR